MSRLKVEKVQIKPLRPIIRDGLQNEQLLEKVVTPGVYLVGQTQATPQILDAWKDHTRQDFSLHDAPQAYTDLKNLALGVKNSIPDDSDIKPHPLMPAVFGGRVCYDSHHLPNPDTAQPGAYLNNIVAQNHWSVLEHAHFNFYLEGVSRSLTHELVRHRHLSFSQESQRYVAQPPRVVVPPNATADEEHGILYCSAYVYEQYKALDQGLLGGKTGLTRKQQREKSRAVLPNCFATNIMVSGNLRSWLEFLQKRLSPAADAEMQQVAGFIKEELAEALKFPDGTPQFNINEALNGPATNEQQSPNYEENNNE